VRVILPTGKAIEAGATWDRWPIPWPVIEYDATDHFRWVYEGRLLGFQQHLAVEALRYRVCVHCVQFYRYQELTRVDDTDTLEVAHIQQIAAATHQVVRLPFDCTSQKFVILGISAGAGDIQIPGYVL